MVEQGPHRLLLYPKHGELQIASVQELIEPLANIDFIGKAIEPVDVRLDFYAGDRFIDLISFLGCSPRIALTPEEGDHYCYIRLHLLTPACQIFSGGNTRPPFCKLCKQTRKDWGDACNSGYCEQCNEQDRMQNWIWRKAGALASTAISVMNIYPHEAIPSPGLLEQLAIHSGPTWAHAYL